MVRSLTLGCPRSMCLALAPALLLVLATASPADAGVVITKTGRVEGNIISPEVSLEAGAKFKGSIDMDAPGDAVTSSARPAHGPKSVARDKPAASEDETGKATA